MIPKARRHQSKKIRASAKGQECQVRLPMCNGNPKTTVFAHLGGGGMGSKTSDLIGCYSCSDCHDVIDSRVRSDYSPAYIKFAQYEAIFRTQQILLDAGLVKI